MGLKGDINSHLSRPTLQLAELYPLFSLEFWNVFILYHVDPSKGTLTICTEKEKEREIEIEITFC